MPEPIIETLHFLRPWWLLLLPAALWLHWRLRRVVSASDQWRQIIDPALLEALLVGGGQRRVRPYQLLTLVLVLTSLALSGPAWQREITPFTQDKAPLVIALELTPSMSGMDQPPTRLERAKQKIRDLLHRRPGARTAVVAYAGSAHAVLPLTDDPDLITLYLDSLSADVMPAQGDRPERALALALDMLADETAPGTVLFMTDGIDRSLADAFRAAFGEVDDQLLVLALGSREGGPLADGSATAPPLDLAGLEAISSAANGWLTLATIDDGDVAAIGNRVQRHLVNALDTDEDLQWRDGGYPLVWPLALLLLLWFRRGWTVQWR